MLCILVSQLYLILSTFRKHFNVILRTVLSIQPIESLLKAEWDTSVSPDPTVSFMNGCMRLEMLIENTPPECGVSGGNENDECM